MECGMIRKEGRKKSQGKRKDRGIERKAREGNETVRRQKEKRKNFMDTTMKK